MKNFESLVYAFGRISGEYKYAQQYDLFEVDNNFYE